MDEINLLYSIPLKNNANETIVKTQLKTEFAKKGITINEIYISFSKKGTAEMLKDEDKAIDVAVIAEFLDRDGMKESEISSLLEINDDIIIIPIIESVHKGDSFIKNLFANGVYNCIYNDEFNLIDLIVSLINLPRKIGKAREYYGLSKNEDFSDAIETIPVVEKVVKEKRSLKKKQLQEDLVASDIHKKDENNKVSLKVQNEKLVEKKNVPIEALKTETIEDEKKVKPSFTISNASENNVIVSTRKITAAEKNKERLFLTLKIFVVVVFVISIALNIILLSDRNIRDILYYTFAGSANRI